MMDDADAGDRGRLAMALGLVGAGSAVCMGTYFAIGGPFGTINDIGNATAGVLSAALAWRLRRRVPGRTGDVAVGAAMVGAAMAVAGSALIVSGTTGWFLGGLVSSVGFAGIGAWLVVLNRRLDEPTAWPRRLRSLGILAGALMTVGITALPGVLLRLDDAATAPGWIWIGFLGWTGIFVAYPAWALWSGLVERRLLRGSTERLRSGEDDEVLLSTAG
jgi:hypothetical protein